MQKDKVPAMVSITLRLINPDDEEKPYTFMTRVYMPVNKSPVKQGPV